MSIYVYNPYHDWIIFGTERNIFRTCRTYLPMKENKVNSIHLYRHFEIEKKRKNLEKREAVRGRQTGRFPETLNELRVPELSFNIWILFRLMPLRGSNVNTSHVSYQSRMPKLLPKDKMRSKSMKSKIFREKGHLPKECASTFIGRMCYRETFSGYWIPILNANVGLIK